MCLLNAYTSRPNIRKATVAEFKSKYPFHASLSTFVDGVVFVCWLTYVKKYARCKVSYCRNHVDVVGSCFEMTAEESGEHWIKHYNYLTWISSSESDLVPFLVSAFVFVFVSTI